jgi:hypothetical protein
MVQKRDDETPESGDKEVTARSTSSRNTTIDLSRIDENGVYGEGSLQSLNELDEKKRILAHWFREKILVFLSSGIIIVVMVVAIVELNGGTDQSEAWGRQILATLLGFAAGAIWQADKKK